MANRTNSSVGTIIVLAAAATLLGSCAQKRNWHSLLQSEDPVERITGAIEAAKHRDTQAVPLLVERLEDEDEAVRMYAIMALKRITGTDLGYKYWADELERAHAAQRWREYVKGKLGPEAETVRETGGTGRCHDATTQTAASPERGKPR